MVTIASFARAFVKVLASISTVSPTRLHRNPAQEPRPGTRMRPDENFVYRPPAQGTSVLKLTALSSGP